MSKIDQSICDKYGKYDENYKVHCNECPLRITEELRDYRCKANSHYNRKTKEWEYDESDFITGY